MGQESGHRLALEVLPEPLEGIEARHLSMRQPSLKVQRWQPILFEFLTVRLCPGYWKLTHSNAHLNNFINAAWIFSLRHQNAVNTL